MSRNYPIGTQDFADIIESGASKISEDAIQQIWDNQYANSHALSKKQIVCIGVCFTMQKRRISGSVILNLEDVEAY
jgi:hypothetical protein